MPGRLVGVELAMRFPSFSARVARPLREILASEIARDCRVAKSLLGDDHQLVDVLDTLHTMGEQLLVVAAVQAAGLELWWEERGARAAVGGRLRRPTDRARLPVALLRLSRRDQCVTLILDGGAQLPLACVRRECRRLASHRYRSRLARSVDDLADEASRRGVRPRPIYARRVGAPAVPQLHEVARLLRMDAPSVRGVALIERLMSSGGSVLYGPKPELLMRELGRATYQLNQ